MAAQHHHVLFIASARELAGYSLNRAVMDAPGK
jgi:hypothetical protein